MIMFTLATEPSAYLPLLVLLAIAIGFALINLGASLVLGPSRTGPVKESTYESGMNPMHTARRRFNIRFYILAMTFLVFDVEIVFLYPWATGFSALADGHYLKDQFLWRMLFFIGTSIVAYVYAWRKGVFRYD